MVPYLGCAQETHQTAPSWLWKRSDCDPTSVCAMPLDLPFKCFCQTVLVAFNLEDLNRLIGRACG